MTSDDLTADDPTADDPTADDLTADDMTADDLTAGEPLPDRHLDPDQRAVWDAMRAVYAGFLAGDAAAADAHLHPDVTIWDSAEPGLVRGLGELQELRGRRTGGGDDAGSSAAPRVIAIEATEPVIDIWGDTAVLRHLLRVRFSSMGTVGHADEIVRNTSVWRRVEGRWLAVHNHEDVLDTS